MRALVVAKAPVAGRVKTRLGAVVGMEAAAELAAAALLDTLAACETAFGDCRLALDGDLRGAAREDELRDRLGGWQVHAQRGSSFGERLAHAHLDAHGDGPTVQVGMDTPQVTAADLLAVAAASRPGSAVLGPAPDGGWWVLGLDDPAAAAGLSGVAMSQADTCAATRQALLDAGRTVVPARSMRDVDTAADAEAVAKCLSDGQFLDAWRKVSPC